MNVLIVDDSPVMRRLVRRGLRQAGIRTTRVREAGDGAQALATLRRERIDLTLTGWHMPEMTGIELLHEIGEQRIDTTVGFVTSHATRNARLTAAKAGAAFLVAKPFTADALHDAVREALAPSSERGVEPRHFRPGRSVNR